MKYFIIALLAIITLDGFAQQKANSGHEVKIVRFEELEKVLNKNDDKLYVVNFWATWCRPCVLELPEFMDVNKANRSNQHFKMILISLDMAKDAKTLVRPFLIKNKIDADVYLLDDNKRMNEWIPAIDKSWSGAIPATVFYKNGKKLEFIESQLNKKELEQIINKYL